MTENCHLAGVPKPADLGFNPLKKSRVPIPSGISQDFPEYRSVIASIGYFAVEGHPSELYFTIEGQLVPKGASFPSPNLTVFSLDGILDRRDFLPGGGHRKIIHAAQSLLSDEARLTETLEAYLADKQPVRGEAPLRL